MSTKRIKINPELLKWAIIESEIPFFQIERKFEKIDGWIEEKEMPTFKQLKQFSEYLKIPFGYLFLKQPPNSELLKKEFRTISNKANTSLSKNLKDVLLDMEYKKNWMSEYRISQGWEQLSLGGQITIDSESSFVSNYLHDLLNLSDNWFLGEKSSEDEFKTLKKAIENVGVIVMISGIVGQNTKKTLDIKEFRAFALMDQYAPLIFINRKDSHAAMLFSLVHEFLHLLLNDDDIITNTEEEHNQTDIERKINIFTAEFLMPTYYVMKKWRQEGRDIDKISNLAKQLNVSMVALAVKLRELALIDENTLKTVHAITTHNLKNREKKSSGGNYYNTLNANISNEFAHAVINQTESGGLRYTEAYRLLGINGKSYQKFKDYKLGRTLKYGE